MDQQKNIIINTYNLSYYAKSNISSKNLSRREKKYQELLPIN